LGILAPLAPSIHSGAPHHPLSSNPAKTISPTLYPSPAPRVRSMSLRYGSYHPNISTSINFFSAALSKCSSVPKANSQPAPRKVVKIIESTVGMPKPCRYLAERTAISTETGTTSISGVWSINSTALSPFAPSPLRRKYTSNSLRVSVDMTIRCVPAFNSFQICIARGLPLAYWMK